NMVALIDGRPRTLSLREILDAFIRHRREVVTRRTIFDLRKARDRAHVLEGLTVALANIDEMIELIKTSASSEEARERMVARRWEPGMVRALLAAAGAEASKPETMAKNVGLRDDGYQLSEVQAQQILEMRLNRLTGLEQEKLTDEYKALLVTIAALIEILENPERLLEVIREELIAIREQYGDARRTVIQISQDDINILDLIAPEDVVVTMSHTGYAKRQPVTTYRAQKRGGKGRSASGLKDEDFVDRLWIANTHDTLLTFTSAGRVYWLKVYQLPESGPNARGKPIVNLLPLQEGEKVQAIQPVHEYSADRFVLFATRNGTVKKTPLTEFEYQLAKGKIAINLDDDDALVDVLITDGDRDVMLFASNGKTVRFDESTVRATGRNSMGVRGIRLAKGEHVVSLIIVDGEGDILTATQRGYGKRTQIDDYPKKGRGIQGVIGIQCSERNGALVGAVQVSEDDGLMLISDQGTLVRTRAAEVAKVGRNTQGVTLIRLPKDEALIGLVRIDPMDEDDSDDEIDGTATDMPEAGENVAGDVTASEPPPDGDSIT
ncbi:MAG: DNA gyrase C-terminal beta-propeller domain-containing protein, partial [Dokdonella sp.]